MSFFFLESTEIINGLIWQMLYMCVFVAQTNPQKLKLL